MTLKIVGAIVIGCLAALYVYVWNLAGPMHHGMIIFVSLMTLSVAGRHYRKEGQ